VLVVQTLAGPARYRLPPPPRSGEPAGQRSRIRHERARTRSASALSCRIAGVPGLEPRL